MYGKVEIKCSCGKTLTTYPTEEFNQKDIAECRCGKKFLIVELTEA